MESCKLTYAAIREELLDFITDSAPATSLQVSESENFRLTLGAARLTFFGLSAYEGQSPSQYDVIAYRSLLLEDLRHRKSRSHSFYFADFDAERAYMWYELGFMDSTSVDLSHEPRALLPEQGLDAFRPAVGRVQLAYGLVPLVPGELEEFIDAWAERFGTTASGAFPSIYHLPDGAMRKPLRHV